MLPVPVRNSLRNIIPLHPDADSSQYSDIYCSSRSIYGLAKDGQAPKIFAKALDNGTPLWAIAISSVFVALGYMNASKDAGQVFDYLVSLITIFAILNWIAILTSYLGFRRAIKAQGISVKSLPFVGWLQPYGAYYSLFISLLVLVFSGKFFSLVVSRGA